MRPNRTRLKVKFALRHIRSVRLGIKDMFDIEQILNAWYSTHLPDVTNTTVTTQQARDWARVSVHIGDINRFNTALGRLYADAYVLGEDLTDYEIARAVGLKKATTPNKKQLVRALGINWDKWKPGNRAAANLVNPPGGLKRLLDQRKIRIGEMTNTTLNRIGTRLADGLNQGVTKREMANLLNTVINDSERAIIIASTEMSRAVVQASKDLYTDLGVEMVEWLNSDPCDECQENLDASPIPIGAEWPNGDPPVHPNCMCDIAPYVIDTQDWAWFNEQE